MTKSEARSIDLHTAEALRLLNTGAPEQLRIDLTAADKKRIGEWLQDVEHHIQHVRAIVRAMALAESLR